MPLTPDQLPDDIAALKQLVMTANAELALRISERDAAKNGLIVVQLTIEKLKAQIAKLKREKFGASSERIERVIEQLELALEDAEAGKAAAEAPTQNAEESAPTPDATPASTDGAVPAEPAAPSKKKRRTLPPALPRRDVVHATPDACKICGGGDLRKVGEAVTEVLEYVPGRFEVIRHVRPACSCKKCEAMMQAPMPELPIPRHGEAMLRMDAWPGRICWRASPSASSAITCRCIVSRRSSRVTASISTAVNSPNGSAISPGF